jgi:hypothetical protein
LLSVAGFRWILTVPDDESDKLKHVRVHALADMLGIETLKQVAAVKLDRELEREFRTEEFAALVREIYLTTASSYDKIREVVVKHASKNLDKLKGNEEFKATLLLYGEFSGNLLLERLSASPYQHKLPCFNCSSMNIKYLHRTASVKCNDCNARYARNESL